MRVSALHIMMQNNLPHEEIYHKRVSEPFHASNTNREVITNTMGNLTLTIEKIDE